MTPAEESASVNAIASAMKGWGRFCNLCGSACDFTVVNMQYDTYREKFPTRVKVCKMCSNGECADSASDWR